MTKSNQKNDENQGENDGKQSKKRIHFYAKMNGNEKWKKWK